MRRSLSECPVCDSRLEVTELTCPACQTTLQGKFDRPPLARLAPERQAFIETFIRCRGVIRDVERALGISYPTVRARLDDAVDALASVQKGDAAPMGTKLDPARESRRKAILKKIEAGELAAEDGAELLRHI